jgi:ankyrin repeat protein
MPFAWRLRFRETPDDHSGDEPVSGNGDKAWTALHEAALRGDADEVTHLLDAGADPNHFVSPRLTARQAAQRRGEGADMPAPVPEDEDAPRGVTPLQLAVIAGNERTVRVLLDRGADPNGGDRTRATPLHRAAEFDRPSLAGILLDTGADVAARTMEGYTPLHTAALTGSAPVAKILLARGGSVGARAALGVTPLHCAAIGDRVTVAEVLIGAGANPASKSTHGLTPADYARTAGSKDVLGLLADR